MMREDMDGLRALAEQNMSDKWRLVEREDGALVCVAHWQFGSRAIAIRPKLMTNEEWRPVGSYIAACDPQTILAILDDNERLRKALDRQCDNMAFVINHVDIHRWAVKFLRELEEDREVLTARTAHEDADARP